MMKYSAIKSGSKKVSSSINMEETVIFDYISPHCDLCEFDLEDSKPIFLNDDLNMITAAGSEITWPANRPLGLPFPLT